MGGFRCHGAAGEHKIAILNKMTTVMTTEKITEKITEDLFEGMNVAQMTVGVAEGLMVINGIIYCDTCWVVRSTTMGLCACATEEKIVCEACFDSSCEPCQTCFPDRRANWTVAMAALDAVMAELSKEGEDHKEEASYDHQQWLEHVRQRRLDEQYEDEYDRYDHKYCRD